MKNKENEYSGMSLNEMLFDAGVISDFDAAVKERNETVLVEILGKVNIPPDNAKKIVKTIFDNLVNPLVSLGSNS